MAQTPSVMVPLGSKAEDFSLPDVVSGKKVTLADFKDKKALLVMFICRHCPYVKNIQNEIAKIGRDYQHKDAGIVAISANDPALYPEDAPESLADMAPPLFFTFPHFFVEKHKTNTKTKNL